MKKTTFLIVILLLGVGFYSCNDYAEVSSYSEYLSVYTNLYGEDGELKAIVLNNYEQDTLVTSDTRIAEIGTLVLKEVKEVRDKRGDKYFTEVKYSFPDN